MQCRDCRKEATITLVDNSGVPIVRFCNSHWKEHQEFAGRLMELLQAGTDQLIEAWEVDPSHATPDHGNPEPIGP